MSLTTTELKEIILARYDPEELVETLEITSEEILNRFDDKLEENWEKFQDLEDDVEREILDWFGLDYEEEEDS